MCKPNQLLFFRPSILAELGYCKSQASAETEYILKKLQLILY